MSTINPLRPDDFPLLANGQYVYRRTASSPIIGPVSMELAADLAARLNRDAYAGAADAVGSPVRDGPFNTVLAR
jgi:hypothetical protein